jgi:hypothetical protein
VLRWRAGLLSLLLLTACGDGPPSATPPQESAPSSAAVAQSFTLVATGDVLIHQDLELTAGALQDDGSYDFSAVLAPVAPLIKAADLAICHVETPVAPPGGPYRGYPSFAVPLHFTRGADGRFAVTRAEAVPLHVDVLDGHVHVVPADPAAFQRVAEVLGRRGAVAAGLAIVPG